MREFLGELGRGALTLFQGTGKLAILLWQLLQNAFASLFQPKLIRPQHVFHQMVLTGYDSVPIISLVGASVGMVLALQAAYQLNLFGAVTYTGSLVSVSMTRELGPLVAAIVIAGRVGARITAELGTMKVQEEVDALRTMGLSPVGYLIAPRCLALICMLPCLTVVADFLGIVGGWLIGSFVVKIPSSVYWERTFDALVIRDIYSGLVKSALFAFLIALVSCQQGLSVKGGAEGVGRATTTAVVLSIVLVIVMDCIATAVIYYAFS